METLIEAICSRDSCSIAAAKALVRDMAGEVGDGADPEEVLYDAGFEPDYAFDLLGWCKA